jgi:DNA replication and repair protein RecF
LTPYLHALRLLNFRNYADETVVLDPGLNVVVGDNAQGKTNLLEGISFTVTGSSLRTPKENEVVRWGEDFARTEARISLDGGSLERKVAVGYAPGQKKRLTVDGAPAPSLMSYAAGGAGIRAVTFFPDDIRIVKGAPADRREFLDGLLSALRPSYARAAVEYARAVQQRNQLLRRIRDGLSSERTLSTWDRKVVDLGEMVLRGREAAMGPLEAHFEDSLRALYAIRLAHP